MDIKSKSQFKRIAMTNPIVATEEWFSTLEENRKLKEELENLKKEAAKSSDAIAPLDGNVFKGEDFSRAELQRKFGEEADWYYNRLAQIANHHVSSLVSKFNNLSKERDSLAQAFVKKDDELTRLKRVAGCVFTKEQLETLEGRVRRVFRNETNMGLLSREFAEILHVIKKAIEFKQEQ